MPEALETRAGQLTTRIDRVRRRNRVALLEGRRDNFRGVRRPTFELVWAQETWELRDLSVERRSQLRLSVD